MGEAPGQTVGYQIAQDSKRSKDTRILFTTTGWLVQRVTHDLEYEFAPLFSIARLCSTHTLRASMLHTTITVLA